MEWKSDEQWMYNTSQQVAATGQWHSVGMESGAGIVNPALNITLFSLMAEIVHTPTGMAEIVQWLNVISILGFLGFIIVKVEKDQRDIWLWGLALAAVSPLAVLFSRKIWAQDILPIFCFLVILFNANRDKRWGAFLWGLFGALIGQIHMSGFFYAAGLVIFTIIYDYRNKKPFKWAYWLAGSMVGSLGLIPWVMYILSHPQPSSFNISHVFQFNFYIYWLLDSHGLNTMYSLHKDFWDFIKEPFIGGYPTYLIALLNIALACTGIYTITRIWGYLKSIVTYIRQHQLFAKLTLNLTSTNFYLLSILLGLGIILNFSGSIVCQHYLIVAFPFTYIFMAKIFQNRKKIFIGILFAQLLLTASFLLYIHTHNGTKEGDYGKTYLSQTKKT